MVPAPPSLCPPIPINTAIICPIRCHGSPARPRLVSRVARHARVPPHTRGAPHGRRWVPRWLPGGAACIITRVHGTDRHAHARRVCLSWELPTRKKPIRWSTLYYVQGNMAIRNTKQGGDAVGWGGVGRGGVKELMFPPNDISVLSTCVVSSRWPGGSAAAPVPGARSLGDVLVRDDILGAQVHTSSAAELAAHRQSPPKTTSDCHPTVAPGCASPFVYMFMYTAGASGLPRVLLGVIHHCLHWRCPRVLACWL